MSKQNYRIQTSCYQCSLTKSTVLSRCYQFFLPVATSPSNQVLLLGHVLEAMVGRNDHRREHSELENEVAMVGKRVFSPDATCKWPISVTGITLPYHRPTKCNLVTNHRENERKRSLILLSSLPGTPLPCS